MSPECDRPLVTFNGSVEGEVGGTCGLRAWAAGPGQQVLSFSLFGKDPEYWQSLDKFLPEVRHASLTHHKLLSVKEIAV